MDNLIQNCNEFLKNATKEKYLYHIKPDNFSGSEIYSLNKVKELMSQNIIIILKNIKVGKII